MKSVILAAVTAFALSTTAVFADEPDATFFDQYEGKKNLVVIHKWKPADCSTWQKCALESSDRDGVSGGAGGSADSVGRE